MTFQDWVDGVGGPVEVAKALKLHPHTVRVWYRGEGAPRVSLIVALIRLSKGRLDFETIVAGAAPKMLGGRRLPRA